MSGFIIHSYANNVNAAKALIAAEYAGVEIKVNDEFEMGKDNKTPEFLAMNPMGQVPVLETEDGAIFESNAIMRHVARSGEGNNLLGQSLIDQAHVDTWIELCNTLQTAKYAWLLPLFKYKPFNGLIYKNAKESANRVLDVLEDHLRLRTYIVGHEITCADITWICNLSSMFGMVLGESWREDHPNIVRWFLTCRNQPQFASLGEIKMVDVEMQAEKKKKGKNKQKKDDNQKQEKPKKKKKPRKPKNPLDLLPASTTGMSIDGTKRLFSNNEFSEACPQFWETYDSEGFSIYVAPYNYNEDNQVLFMTSNLMGGFVQRLDKLRNYGFGCLLASGPEEGPFNIVTCWIFRGADVPQEMLDCSDSEYYTFTKLNTDSPADRERFETIWNAEVVDGGVVQDRRFFK